MNNARYHLPKKAIKADCPDCGHRYKKKLSRYVDRRTGEPLPEMYGLCDRASNCGYHLSPYHKDPSGMSYADEVKQRLGNDSLPREWFIVAGKLERKGLVQANVIEALCRQEGATVEQAERVVAYIFGKDVTPTRQHENTGSLIVTEGPVYSIPDEVFRKSLGHYDYNQFSLLLHRYFGETVADELLSRFQIGTSVLWPGACVFWYIDELGRKRGGQIKLFDETFHTVKYIDQNGEKRIKTSWVHTAYARRCDEQQKPYPDWLVNYLDERNDVQKSPCLFGLPQLLEEPADKPIAVVEAPKTAILCTPQFRGFIWLAVGALSYLNTERLAPLRGRNVILFPDLSKDGSAYARWSRIAENLRTQGYNVTVSDYLELRATDEQKVAGYDLADYLLDQWNEYPPEWKH
ncbi:hypothetical protein Slin_3094 [Spirosoma linguale DSM 74]|uniref:Uncharacterized protein n=1 Tax=Spirosoma linguale (strain ATCC 33905 / DSM 74 / LMG 10896 / Claus 1) TaxID=504472 RepID=D2QLF8_SPILD|nr:hypothetical protein Slin_3094 [Spirosoma linguale DSM 74]